MEQSALSILFSIAILIVACTFVATIAWNVWLSYVQKAFLRGIKWTLYEIRPPKDVFKSPLAMELMLGALYQTGGTGNWYDKYWKGQVRNWFSLEIASFEGSIHFYVRSSEKFKKLVESQIYAQYPQAEVFEVQDYTKQFPKFKKNNGWELWACEFKLDKDEPFPIRTYVDYGLDRAVGSLEEAERIDPITPMLEFMGSIGKGENILFQILVRADTKRFTITKDGKEVGGKSWQDKAKEIAEKMRKELKFKPGEEQSVVTKGQKDIIESLERSISKLGFDCGIRSIYITDKEKFDPNRIGSLTGMLRQYSNGEVNSFKLGDKTAFDYPWQDLFGRKKLKLQKDMLEDYKDRVWFYGGGISWKLEEMKFFKSLFKHPNVAGKTPFILNSEELATIFHLPGRVVETPTFGRLDATKAEPPGNLPV